MTETDDALETVAAAEKADAVETGHATETVDTLETAVEAEKANTVEMGDAVETLASNLESQCIPFTIELWCSWLLPALANPLHR